MELGLHGAHTWIAGPLGPVRARSRSLGMWLGTSKTAGGAKRSWQRANGPWACERAAEVERTNEPATHERASERTESVQACVGSWGRLGSFFTRCIRGARSLDMRLGISKAAGGAEGERARHQGSSSRSVVRPGRWEPTTKWAGGEPAGQLPMGRASERQSTSKRKALATRPLSTVGGNV